MVNATVIVTSMAMAVAGLISTPAADAFQPAAVLSVTAVDGQQVGRSIGRIEKLLIKEASVMIKHEPIAALGMPDMTMLFRVASPRQLTGLHVGDQVRFEVRRVRGALVISAIERSR